MYGLWTLGIPLRPTLFRLRKEWLRWLFIQKLISLPGTYFINFFNGKCWALKCNLFSAPVVVRLVSTSTCTAKKENSVPLSSITMAEVSWDTGLEPSLVSPFIHTECAWRLEAWTLWYPFSRQKSQRSRINFYWHFIKIRLILFLLEIFQFEPRDLANVKCPVTITIVSERFKMKHLYVNSGLN